MRASLVLAVGWSLALPAKSSLTPRQAPGNVDSSVFLRRAYHSSVVLNNWVYIDGGEFSYSASGNVQYQYSSTLLAINLARDWTNSSVNIQSISKPAGCPNLRNGGIWTDYKNGLLYTGFSGVNSFFGDDAEYSQGLWSFTPSPAGSDGSWTSLNDTADATFVTQPRAFKGEVASGNGEGFFLGGYVGNDTTLQIPISGLVTYNFSSQKLHNETTAVASVDNQDQLGGMHFVQNFGPRGIIVSVGGDEFGTATEDSDNLVPFTNVQIYDVDQKVWYQQKSSGTIPEARKEYCMTGVASDNQTYEIIVYAGWDGHLGSESVQYDEVYVLSLPGFYWVKADYAAENPRHGLTCNSVGGGQILTIGGVDTTQNGPDDLYADVFNTPDPFAQGLAIFDLNSLAWKSSFSSKQNTYTPAPEILSFYDGNTRSPYSGWSSDGLQTLFSVQNFNNGDGGGGTGGGNGTSPSSSATSNSSSTNVGAIVGGVVGGVVGAIVLAGAIFFLVRCCRRRQGQRGSAIPQSDEQAAGRNAPTPSYATQAGGDNAEKQNGLHELPPEHRTRQELAEGPPARGAAELPTNQNAYELE